MLCKETQAMQRVKKARCVYCIEHSLNVNMEKEGIQTCSRRGNLIQLQSLTTWLELRYLVSPR